MPTLNHTYNVIIAQLKSFADSHSQIKSFSHGDLPSFDRLKEMEFISMHVVPRPFQVDRGSITYNLDILFYDLPLEKTDSYDYIKEIISDTTQIAVDLISTIANDDFFGDNVMVGLPAMIEPLISEFPDILSGVMLSLSMSTDLSLNFCLVPLENNNNDTISIYSQVIDFETTPMNSIIYRCDGEFIHACYGTNQNNITDFVSMLNANPPVQNNSCFLEYGYYFDNGDGRVRCEMPIEIANSLCIPSFLTIEVIYD
ncbi:hypothetical protein UFOVP386_26 [uncultured Caudovirales phage]|uniref:Uncharacterized protein n=1 Tax=uncultured Caudovirales phage TaxID=2100421 RepID=A0A6J7X138_9CAUD|nr:hypothetical protein UFOVP386_26 [uncultured Caudovirales phage]